MGDASDACVAGRHNGPDPHYQHVVLCSHLSIKRLHDRNKSGWWMALFFIVPSLLGKLSDRLGDQTAVFIVSGIGLGLSVWCFVEIFCLKGTKGPNRFGPDPLAKGNMIIGAISRAPA
jgi:uncharacterized membrane protein YhaH (DUF805 family)